MRNVAAIVLAAGKASRYRAADPEAATKVAALYKGEPMVRRAACAALNAGVSPVVVVTGCEPQAVRDALAGLDVTFAHNGHYESGIASSVHTGIAALPDTTEAAFVMLGDMPLVDAKLLQSLDAARLAAGNADAVLPVHGGQRGNPVLMGRSLFAEAMALTGDEGARKLLRNSSLTIVEVEAGEGAVVDIDTPEALRSAEARE